MNTGNDTFNASNEVKKHLLAVLTYVLIIK